MGKQKASDPVTHLVGGAVSGLAACVFVQPLDVIKTRLQQQQQAHLAFLKEGGRAGLKIAPLESTIWKTVAGVVKEGSVLSLWRGTVPTIVRNVPGAAMYFSVLNETRVLMAKRKLNSLDRSSVSTANSTSALPKLSNTENLIAGGTSRAAIGFLMMPATVIKVRYESNLYNYTSMSSAFSSIFRTEGIRGLWAGFGATALRDAPLAGLYVLFYEQSKGLLGEMRTSGMLSLNTPTIHMVSGVAAGFLSTTLTHPFDMLKTRMQLKPSDYKNVLHAARKVFLEEGMIGFFDGILVRTIRKSVHSAITWTVYEEVVRWYTAQRADQHF
ncbi:hypothetical protein BGZ73_005211 [Actinomortierella ambigua]|nr:hypothetical protein BGZ73_005211 [Actinomortierella ambigua]